MQGYNIKKGKYYFYKKKKTREEPNREMQYREEEKKTEKFTTVRLRSLVLPAKQANIVFDPFVHSIINVITMVEGNRLIASSITHRHRRLYHKFPLRICAQMNIYLICHLWLRVCSMSWLEEINLFNNDQKYLRRMYGCV